MKPAGLLDPAFVYVPTSQQVRTSFPPTPRQYVSPMAYAAAIERPAQKPHGVLWRFFFGSK